MTDEASPTVPVSGGNPDLPVDFPAGPVLTLSDLTGETMRGLRTFFATTEHRPSEDQLLALEDLARTLSAMATGEAEPTFYLSDLDPGVGKTQTLTAFLDALLGDRTLYDVGVIICLSRLAEIDALAKRIRLPQEWLAVVTSNEKINALGCDPSQHDRARVLVTTQAMVERRCERRGFEAASEFWYRGAPRHVRVWDESCLPGRSLTLSPFDILALPRLVSPRFPELAHRLVEMAREIEAAADDSLYAVPDLEVTYGVSLNDALGLLRNRADDRASVISTLWSLQGQAGRVRRDGTCGNTLLDFTDTLPADLAPMVILDASGRIRETYPLWERARGTLTHLRTAPKSYGALTIHVWERSGGKDAYTKHGEEIADGVVEVLSRETTDPGDETLLVIHKKNGRRHDMERWIRERLPADFPGRLHFIHWGAHTATNDYAHVRRVILVGTLFLRPSAYEALGRLSAGLHAADGPYGADERRRIEAGEHAHFILQALCRAAVRLSDGDGCPPCDAWIIASKQSGIPDALPSIFPGCRVVPWVPTTVPTVLRGKVKAAVEVIAEWLEWRREGDDLLPFGHVQAAIGIMGAGNFRKNVQRHPDFLREMARLGIEEWGKGRRKTHCRARDNEEVVSAFPDPEPAHEADFL